MNGTTSTTLAWTVYLTSNQHASEDVSNNLVTSDESNGCRDGDTFVSTAPVVSNCSKGSDPLVIKKDKPVEIAIVTPKPTLKSGSRRRRRPIPQTPITHQEEDLASQIEAMALEAEAAFATCHVKKKEFMQFMDEFENRHKKGANHRSTPLKKLTLEQGLPKKALAMGDCPNAATTTISVDPLSIVLVKRRDDAPRSHDVPDLQGLSNDSLASLSSDCSSRTGWTTRASVPQHNEVWPTEIIVPFR
jgi:hypothetical protein